MTEKITQIGLVAMMALMAWNFNTLNKLQIEVEGMMYKHANAEDINELKLTVRRLQWMLQDDAMEN